MEGSKSCDEKVVAVSREGEVHPGAWVGPESKCGEAQARMDRQQRVHLDAACQGATGWSEGGR